MKLRLSRRYTCNYEPTIRVDGWAQLCILSYVYTGSRVPKSNGADNTDY